MTEAIPTKRQIGLPPRSVHSAAEVVPALAPIFVLISRVAGRIVAAVYTFVLMSGSVAVVAARRSV